jgi:flagellar basal-body rod modification protein FlgD
MTTVMSATGAASAAASAGSSLTSAADQADRFMKLLVAQMKNQDPLNPMDNAQMTSQIAQINTVAGIEQLNTTVGSLLTAFNTMQAQTAVDLPGRSVLVDGSALALAGGQATGGVQLAADADAVQVQILDAAGRTVQTLALGKTAAGARSFTWDGRDANGDTLPDGTYTMRASANAGGQAVAAQPLTAAQVLAVSTAGGAVQLDLGSAGTQPWSAVRSFL